MVITWPFTSSLCLLQSKQQWINRTPHPNLLRLQQLSQLLKTLMLLLWLLVLLLLQRMLLLPS